MGLFGKKEDCPICGQPVKGVYKLKIKDNVALCWQCASKVKMDVSKLSFQSLDDIKKHLKYREDNKVKFDDFTTSREISIGGVTSKTVIGVDEEKKLWYYDSKKAENPSLFRFDEIIDFELSEDGDTITKGGIGRAVAGGILLGGVGAVVGGITGKKKTKTEIRSINLRVSLSNEYISAISIECVPSGITCKSGSMTYNMYKQTANDLVSLFDHMCSLAENNTNEISTSTTNADEILRYKQLLDCGAITQEEFDAKKAQLLGL